MFSDGINTIPFDVRTADLSEAGIPALLERLRTQYGPLPECAGWQVRILGVNTTAEGGISSEVAAGVERFWRKFVTDCGGQVVRYGVASAPQSTPTPTTPAPTGAATTVAEHVDGDTFAVQGGLRVRLIGVDTPETKHPTKPVQCFGTQASDHLAQLLPLGTPVELVTDVDLTDRYGRILAYVVRVSDGLDVNAALVRDGYARPMTVPPNVARAAEYAKLAAEARTAGRGLWSAC